MPAFVLVGLVLFVLALIAFGLGSDPKSKYTVIGFCALALSLVCGAGAVARGDVKLPEWAKVAAAD